MQSVNVAPPENPSSGYLEHDISVHVFKLMISLWTTISKCYGQMIYLFSYSHFSNSGLAALAK